MLLQLVASLIKKNMMQMAMGIVLRNSLEKYAKPDIKLALSNVRYDPE